MFQERAILSGTTLDKYDLLEKVGEGGMAEVYRARHTALGRIVAVKILHPHLSSTERNRLRFEREARAIESLQHPNILKIFDYSGRDSHTCFIVTEFIEGLTLKEILTRVGHLPSELAAMVGIELCRALTYAHERGIVHRDIKPENVMIRVDGVVKLMDFGIARVLDESTMTLTGGLVGSPAYMSPEQASDGDIDHRSDLFSLGTLLYRTVTGHLPFLGGNAPVILRNILEGQYVDPMDLEPGLSARLADIIRQMLSVSPADRFQSAHDIELGLLEVLEQAGIEHDPTQLVTFLQNPDAWQEAHKRHLCQRLPEVGRKLIEAGDKVHAMKVFNRVLYYDEQNEQVRALIQSLYRSHPSLERVLMLAAAIVAVPLLLWGLWWSLQAAGWWPVPAASSAPNQTEQQGLRAPAQSVAALSSQELEPVPTLEGGELSPAPLTPVDTLAGDNTQRAVPLPPSPRVSTAGTGTAAPGGTGTAAPATPGEGAPRARPAREVVSQASGGSSRVPDSNRRAVADRAPVSSPQDVLPGLVLVQANYQAEVYLDNKKIGNARAMASPVPIAPGTYRLKLINESCEPYEETLVVQPGRVVTRNITLSLLPATLELLGGAPEGEIILAGERRGTIASLRGKVSARALIGKTSLLVRLPDGSERSYVVPELRPREVHRISLEGSTP